jgi:S1-C subfamily serine protease
MKKEILSTVMLYMGILLLSLCVFAGFSNSKTSLYKNMVNASVMISNDYGFGSGVFIDDDVILTAGHVLIQPDLIIELNDGTILGSSDFYIDDEEDIGFIFVDINELYIAKVSSDIGEVGDTVYLVGTPYDKDYKFTLTKGILSHLDRDIWGERDWKDLLQTDAEGAPGSSGSPLYDSVGQVIGIVVTGPNPGGGITLCESAKSILEAYERCLDARR